MAGERRLFWFVLSTPITAVHDQSVLILILIFLASLYCAA